MRSKEQTWPWWRKIEAARLERGWSRRDVARRLREPAQALDRWLTGAHRPRDRAGVIQKMARIFALPVAYLENEFVPWPPTTGLSAQELTGRPISAPVLAIMAQLIDQPALVPFVERFLELTGGARPEEPGPEADADSEAGSDADPDEMRGMSEPLPGGYGPRSGW